MMNKVNIKNKKLFKIKFKIFKIIKLIKIILII